MRIVKNYVIRYVFILFKEFLKFILKYHYRLKLHLKMPEYTIFIMLHSTSNVYIVSTHASSNDGGVHHFYTFNIDFLHWSIFCKTTMVYIGSPQFWK